MHLKPIGLVMSTLLVAMGFTMAGVELSALPTALTNAAQLVSGVSLGVRFRREFLRARRGHAQRDQRRAGSHRLVLQAGDTARIAALAQHRRAQPHASRCGLGQRGEQVVARGGQHDQLQVFEKIEQVLPVEQAVALLSAQVAARKQTAKLAPGRTIARISEDVGCLVGKDEPRAGMIVQRQFLLALQDMGAHDAGDRVAVAKTETPEADGVGL